MATKAGLGNQVPPAWVHVQIFFDQAGVPEAEPQQFFKHYQEVGWKGLKGGTIRNWKTKAQEWIWELKMRSPYLRVK